MSEMSTTKVAVLFGGNSAEREVSIKSGSAVLNALKGSGVDAIAFDPAEQPLEKLKELGIEVAFIALHGRGGEDGSIQGALAHLGIRYTGSGVMGSALAMDKVRTKHLFRALELPTAPYMVVTRGEQPDIEQILEALGGKVMVKPANEGSSIGMTIASSSKELANAVAVALNYDDEVLIEKWIDGAEYTVSILADQALPVIEMRTPNTFYDYEAKYQSNTTEYYCPCDLELEKQKALQDIAEKAFRAVGASSWGRVDAMLDSSGNFHLLEVNTVPGMTEKSLVPMAALANGVSFAQLCLTIMKQAHI